MKRIGIRILFPVFIFSFLVFGSSSSFGASGTAKQFFSVAQDAANKWKSDAQLVQIVAMPALGSGSSEKWLYVFYSPSAGTGFQVDVRNNVIRSAFEASTMFHTPIDTDFIDSPVALEEAQKNGMETGEEVSMMLHVMMNSTKNEAPYWNISADIFAENQISFLVNANTGRFFRKQ